MRAATATAIVIVVLAAGCSGSPATRGSISPESPTTTTSTVVTPAPQTTIRTETSVTIIETPPRSTVSTDETLSADTLPPDNVESPQSTAPTTGEAEPAGPIRPTTPEATVDLLVTVERGLADEGLDPDSDAARRLGEQQQVLYGLLGRNDGWMDQARVLLDGDGLARTSAIVDAGSAAASSTGTPSTTVPAWTIRDPLPGSELLPVYRQAETETGVPWSILAAVHFVETRFGRIDGVSSAGAQGPMQFLPSTWAIHGQGGDIDDDADAIAAAARLLSDAGAPNDLEGALFSYNPSSSYVSSVLCYHEVLQAEPWLYTGFHGWRVFVSTTAGVIPVPVGYSATEPTPVDEFIATYGTD